MAMTTKNKITLTFLALLFASFSCFAQEKTKPRLAELRLNLLPYTSEQNIWSNRPLHIQAEARIQMTKFISLAPYLGGSKEKAWIATEFYENGRPRAWSSATGNSYTAFYGMNIYIHPFASLLKENSRLDIYSYFQVGGLTAFNTGIEGVPYGTAEDIGWFVGASYRFTKRLGVNANYGYGLQNNLLYPQLRVGLNFKL